MIRSTAAFCFFVTATVLPACGPDSDTAESDGDAGDSDGADAGGSEGGGSAGGSDGGGGDGDGDGDAGGDSDSGGGDGDGTGGEDGACPDGHFPAVSPDPANAEYEDPYLNAYCTSTELIVEANGIPGYEFQELTPNGLAAQDYEWHIPLEPTELATPESIPLLGAAGIAINGLPIYGPNEGPFPDPYGDPVYNGIMDFCMGHTGGAADYHYHALLVECLTALADEAEPDPVIGYSFDGYPIYGPRGCVDAECTEIVEHQSGWEVTGDPTTYAWDNYTYVEKSDPIYMDECNGHVGPDGDYHYHATAGFPYILGCYHGEPTANMGAGMGDTGGETGGDTGGMDPDGDPPMCEPGQMMCCGDGVCGGPETPENCEADCG